MAKIYFAKPIADSKMLPKKETIAFLLRFSQALSIQKKGKLIFETISN